MKFFLVLLLLSGLAYGGYYYYRQSQSAQVAPTMSLDSSSNLTITQTSDKLGELTQVLGASISNLVEDGQTYLSEVTNGASEPVINQLVTKTQETLKDLPKKEAERIKYEFCRGVIEEYENKSTNEN